jgi:hypothetical protein
MLAVVLLLLLLLLLLLFIMKRKQSRDIILQLQTQGRVVRAGSIAYGPDPHGENRTSHLTPPSHTSHLTPHTSHLTPHTSHITPHTSHLPPHTSHLTHHTSHVAPAAGCVGRSCAHDQRGTQHVGWSQSSAAVSVTCDV